MRYLRRCRRTASNFLFDHSLSGDPKPRAPRAAAGLVVTFALGARLGMVEGTQAAAGALQRTQSRTTGSVWPAATA